MKRTRLNKKAKSHSQGWWQSKCDKLLQLCHKYMFKRCLVCGGKNQVGHHFVTKALSSYLRYSFENLIPLCFSCHFKHHIQSDPAVSEAIKMRMGNEWYQRIEDTRRKLVKMGIYELKLKHDELTNLLSKLSS